MDAAAVNVKVLPRHEGAVVAQQEAHAADEVFGIHRAVYRARLNAVVVVLFEIFGRGREAL